MGDESPAVRGLQDAERTLASLVASERWFDAALIAHQLGRPLEAAELFERAGRHAEAAECFFEGGAHERSLEVALQVPRRHGLYQRSVQVALRAALVLRRADPRLDEIVRSVGTLDLNDTVAFELHAGIAQYRAMASGDPVFAEPEPHLGDRADGAPSREPLGSLFGGPASEPRLGDVFAGRFRLDRALGRGGTATVYVAHDAVLEEDVALKVMCGPTDGDTAARMRREIQLARKLTHESIVRVFDLVMADGFFAISMELVDGQPLSGLIECGPLPLVQARDLLVQAARALAFAHQRGVVHRDVKPENMLISKDGLLKISDFGIAKAQQNMVSITRTGATLGTPHYIAPEQIQDFKQVDHRADIYALGVMAYELFTGRLPFEADSLLAILTKHLSEWPTPLTAVRPELPADLEWLVAEMLQKDPAKRVQSCDLVVSRLTALPFL
jgi:serine/threonine-protein kinase